MPTSLTAEERNMIHTEALTNDGTPPSESVWDYYTNPENVVTRTGWFDEIFISGYIATHDLSMHGGTKASNFMFSFGYLNDNGVVDNSNFKRYNLRFNSQHDIIGNLSFGENISLVSTDQMIVESRGSYDGVLSAALFNMRNTPVWQDEANEIYGMPKGDIPNNSGDCIEVSWSNEPDSCYIYNLDIPPGISAFLDIPVELKKRILIINDKFYAKSPHRLRLEGGNHEIVFRTSGQEK